MISREALSKRAADLRRQRADILDKAQRQMATLDQQIAACEDLAARWDALALPEALQLAARTGIRVRTD